MLGAVSPQPLPYYWSHFGTTRVRAFEACELPQLTSHDQLYELVKEAAKNGTTAFKSNICSLAGSDSFVYMPGSGKGTKDLKPSWTEAINAVKLIESWLDTCYKAAPNCSFAIDLNYNIPSAALRNLPELASWYELDFDSSYALNQTPINATIVSGENILELAQQANYLSNPFVQIMSVDPAWLSWSRLSSTITLSELYSKTLTLHNYNSHLSTAIAFSYGQLIPNLHYIELDLDDVKWKDSIVDKIPVVANGRLDLKVRAGWGVNPLIEEMKPYLLYEY